VKPNSAISPKPQTHASFAGPLSSLSYSVSPAHGNSPIYAPSSLSRSLRRLLHDMICAIHGAHGAKSMLGAAVYRNALDCRIRRYKMVADLAFWNSTEGERISYSTGYRCDLFLQKPTHTMVLVQRQHHPISRMLRDGDTGQFLTTFGTIFFPRCTLGAYDCRM
jgi:hypothetical protein